MPRKRKPLNFDFSSLDFSLSFDPAEEAHPINRLSPVPVSDENAEALARHIDWTRDYICLVSGAFVFGDFLELLLYAHDLQPTAVYIATLGMSENNMDSIVNMVDYLDAVKVNLIVSHYFEGVERHKLFPRMEREFAGRPVDIAVLQSHCKICLIRSPKGDGVICGSANLSSSNNAEQFTIMHDPAAISYLQARLDNIMERFTAFRGLSGESDHRRKRNTGRDAYMAMISNKMGGVTMGERNGALYLDGKPIEDMPEFSICDGNRDASLMMGFAFCGNIAVMPRPATTCKTRKRFIKLLMANGYSRNEANERAERARRFGYSYQDFFFLLLPLARIFRKAVNHNGKR